MTKIKTSDEQTIEDLMEIMIVNESALIGDLNVALVLLEQGRMSNLRRNFIKETRGRIFKIEEGK